MSAPIISVSSQTQRSFWASCSTIRSREGWAKALKTLARLVSLACVLASISFSVSLFGQVAKYYLKEFPPLGERKGSMTL